MAELEERNEPGGTESTSGTSVQAEAPRFTLIEQFGISPVLFAVGCLIIVFILYQLVGGLLTLALFGMKPGAEHVLGFRIATGIGQIWFILVPTLIFTQFATYKPAEYLRLGLPHPGAFVFPIFGILSLQQMLQVVMTLEDKIPLPEKLERIIEPIKQSIEEVYKMIVGAHSVPELLFVLLIVALIPAICEEFLFRGLVQRSLEKGLGTWRGVIFTGVIFGAYHLNPFAFIPLAALGVYLGFIAMRSGSLWVSSLAHFFNNAVAVTVAYLNYSDDALVTGDASTMSWQLMLGSFMFFSMIFAASTYGFLRVTDKPAIPTPTSA